MLVPEAIKAEPSAAQYHSSGLQLTVFSEISVATGEMINLRDASLKTSDFENLI